MEGEMEVPQVGILLIALLYQKSPFLRTGFLSCLRKGCRFTNFLNCDSASKLILVSALVGFVCVNIIAIMFNYIDKFHIHLKTDDNNLNNISFKLKNIRVWLLQKVVDHFFVVIIDTILIVTMILSGCYCAKNNTDTDIPKNSDTNISVNVNIPKDEQLIEPDSSIDESSHEESETTALEETSSLESEFPK